MRQHHGVGMGAIVSIIFIWGFVESCLPVCHLCTINGHVFFYSLTVGCDHFYCLKPLAHRLVSALPLHSVLLTGQQNNKNTSFVNCYTITSLLQVIDAYVGYCFFRISVALAWSACP